MLGVALLVVTVGAAATLAIVSRGGDHPSPAALSAGKSTPGSVTNAPSPASAALGVASSGPRTPARATASPQTAPGGPTAPAAGATAGSPSSPLLGKAPTGASATSVPHSAAEVLAPHEGAVGTAPAEGTRPAEVPTLVVAAPAASSQGAVRALVGAAFPLTQRSGPGASKELSALLDAGTITSVARYVPASAAKVGYSILIEFRDEEAAIAQAKILSDTRRSHLSGETVIVRAGRLVGGYVPAPGQPDRAEQFYAAMASLAP